MNAAPSRSDLANDAQRGSHWHHRFVRLCGVWLAFTALLILVQPIHGLLFCFWCMGERCGKLMNITERIGSKWQKYRRATL